jgi:hypothetical protein
MTHMEPVPSTISPRSSVELDARRLKLIVYPALFAFILLSAYGFYLIYHLAQDVHTLTLEIASLNRVVDSNVGSMTDNLEKITERMAAVPPIAASMATITRNMENMNWSTAAMAASTNHMQHDMRNLNHSVSTPMNMMPWNFFNPFH